MEKIINFYQFMTRNTLRKMVFSMPVFIVTSVFWGFVTETKEYFANFQKNLVEAFIGSIVIAIMIYPIDKYLQARRKKLQN